MLDGLTQSFSRVRTVAHVRERLGRFEQEHRDRVAWQLVGVFWLRDVAYLMDLGRSVYEGSIILMDTILRSIST